MVHMLEEFFPKKKRRIKKEVEACIIGACVKYQKSIQNKLETLSNMIPNLFRKKDIGCRSGVQIRCRLRISSSHEHNDKQESMEHNTLSVLILNFKSLIVK